MPLGMGSRCCLQHQALQRQQQLHRGRALPRTRASSDARAGFVESSRQPWFVGMLLLLPTVKIGEAATEVSPSRICAFVIAFCHGCPACSRKHSIVQVLEATSTGVARQTGLGYLVSLDSRLHKMSSCISLAMRKADVAFSAGLQPG